MVREFVNEILRKNQTFDAAYYKFERPSELDMVRQHIKASLAVDAAAAEAGFFAGVTKSSRAITIPAANIQAGRLYVVSAKTLRSGVVN